MPSFADFSEIGQQSIYIDWPVGWSLVLTDIKGSTKAIQQGRYKEVNLIGTASIAAYVKCAKTQEVPFVFGGDGATLLVPNSMLKEIVDELQSLQNISHQNFSLDLRIGYIDIDELRLMGQQLKVAKYQLSKGNYLAQFAGGALSLAETLVKTKHPKVTLLNRIQNFEVKSLEGISCRLQPLRSQHGKILTLLCKPTQEFQSIEIINQVVSKINMILQSNIQTANPANKNNLKWLFFPKTLFYEIKLFARYNFIIRLKKIVFAIISNMSLQFEFNMGNFTPKKYKNELITNSDFKKFDETLRMVLDCTEDQIKKINSLLNDLYLKNEIYYGTHISDEALMTCMVESPVENRHIHFIDGADGGYAMAAIELKKQISDKLPPINE